MRNIGSSVGISFVTTWLARRAQFNQSVLAAHVTPTIQPPNGCWLRLRPC